MLIIVHLCSLRLPAAINYTYIVLTLLSNPSLLHHHLPHFPFPPANQIHRPIPGDSLKVLDRLGHGHGSHPRMKRLYRTTYSLSLPDRTQRHWSWAGSSALCIQMRSAMITCRSMSTVSSRSLRVIRSMPCWRRCRTWTPRCKTVFLAFICPHVIIDL